MDVWENRNKKLQSKMHVHDGWKAFRAQKNKWDERGNKRMA